MKTIWMLIISVAVFATAEATRIVDYAGFGSNANSRPADVDTTTGDTWHFSESAPLVQHTWLTNGTVYGGVNTTWSVPMAYAPNLWLGATFEVRVIPDNSSDTALKGIVFWKKDDFLNGAGTGQAGFSSGDSLSANITIVSGTSIDIRFVVKQGGQWYVSDTKKTAAGLFELDPSAAMWRTISTGDYAIGDEVSVELDDVEAVGLYTSASGPAQQSRVTFDRFSADATVIPGPGISGPGLFFSIASHPEPIVLSGQGPVSLSGVTQLSWLGDNMSLEEATANLGLSLRPLTANEFDDYNWLYEKGDSARFRLQFNGHPDITRTVLTLWDWYGNPVHSQTFSSFPINAVLETRMDAYGIWMATFDAYENANAASLRSRLVRSFGAVPDARSRRSAWKNTNGYMLGSCFFPLRYHRWGAAYSWQNGPLSPLTPDQGIEKLLELAAGCGFTILRTDTYNYNPKNPTWAPEWNFFESIAEKMGNHGLSVDLKYTVGPESFLGDTLVPNEALMNAWKDDLEVFIQRFIVPRETDIAVIEIGNEPAHEEFWAGTREQYQHLTQYAIERLAQADPDILLLHGGTCSPGANLSGEKISDPESYEIKRQAQEEWYDAFYRDMADITPVGAYHFHGAITEEKLAWRQWEADQLTEYASQPPVFIQTEGGSSAWRPDLEISSWAEVLQKIHWSMARREKGWLQYNLAFHTGSSRYRDRIGWSMIDGRTLSPKFQYGAMAGMVFLLADCTFEETLFEADAGTAPRIVAQYSHPAGKMLVYFAVAGQQMLDVSSDAHTVTAIDAMGNVTGQLQTGNTAITLNAFPRYLLLEGATAVNVSVR